MELTIDEINNLANNNDVLMQRNEKLIKALEDIKNYAGKRFVSGLNEEADCYNQDMDMITARIDEVLNELHN